MIRTWWSSFEVEVRFKEFQWSEQVVVCLLLQVGSTKTHMVVEFRGGGQVLESSSGRNKLLYVGFLRFAAQK